MALNTRIWMNGALEWVALIDGEEVFLGQREVPAPLRGWIHPAGRQDRAAQEILVAARGWSAHPRHLFLFGFTSHH